MLNKFFYKSISSSYFQALLFSLFSAVTALAQDYIVPVMIDIPAGDFMMGTEGGDSATQPMHLENISAFKMGKYAVTVAEFRKFAEDTGFNPESTCGDLINSQGLGGPRKLGSGRWDKHRYSFSEYQPVTCVSWQDANAYAKWLSNKTGIEYRLPTEQEWEYAAKAGTTGRYFWGDDFDLTQACLYGNFADRTGEHVNNEKYGLSNVGWIGHVNCDDNEAYNSIVGLYRPNPFGLFDMLGNVGEFLSSCYFKSGYKTYSKAELAECKFVTHRGGNWHYPAQPHSNRGRYKREGWNRVATLGFRLAANYHEPDASTVEFENKLIQAQAIHIATRVKRPVAPKNLQLVEMIGSAKSNQYKLSWQPSVDSRVIEYDVYQADSPYAHLYGSYYQKYYKKIITVNADVNNLVVDLPNKAGSFRVISKVNKLKSLPSQPVSVVFKDKLVHLPGKIFMENTVALKNVNLRKSANVENLEPFYISKTNKSTDHLLVTATFDIKVKKSAWYNINYRGRTRKSGLFFKLWQNNRLLGDIGYDPDIDDKVSNRHQVFLTQGSHSLQLSVSREGFDMWNITWLEFTEVSH